MVEWRVAEESSAGDMVWHVSAVVASVSVLEVECDSEAVDDAIVLADSVLMSGDIGAGIDGASGSTDLP